MTSVEERQDRVRAAIEDGASSWRVVGEAAGLSHEGARQIATRIGLELSPDERVPSATPKRSAVNRAKGARKRRRRRQPRASIWDERVVARFWENVDKDGRATVTRSELGQCWTWLGRRRPSNYGVHSAFRSKQTAAHRYSWMLLRGPIPQLHLDHLCHSVSTWCPGGDRCEHRACVNPDHLEPVTAAENNRRIVHRGVRKVMFCRYGHRYDEYTTLYDLAGKRWCRACLERWAE